MTELLDQRRTVPDVSSAESGQTRAGSCLYRGWIRHRRYGPRRHDFRYRLFMVHLDLDELDQVFDGRWLWSTRRIAPVRFRRRDYLGPTSVPLKQAVLDEVERRIGRRPAGAVRMLTNLRHFGFSINPVTFYYCHDIHGDLNAICAEITNTPWRQRHRYVLDVAAGEGCGSMHRFRFRKDFHVSPFFPMEQDYDWRFSAPGDRLLVHMENYQEGEMRFDATLNLERREISGGQLARALASHPFMTAKVFLGIYWNALRLWLKRVPFHKHPDKRS